MKNMFIFVILISSLIISFAGCQFDNDNMQDESGLKISNEISETGRPKPGDPPKKGWADSYSANGKCYCASTFDHGIGKVKVMTPAGLKTVKEICDKIGKGPGKKGNPLYNDVQCGNGPANNAGDEDWCPGRVDMGKKGCNIIGPKWDLSVFEGDDDDDDDDDNDNQAPSVSFTKTTLNKKKLILVAKASDDIGVVKIEFYVNSALKETDTMPPYKYVMKKAKAKSYAVKAIAYDAENLTAEVTKTVKKK